MQTCVFVSTIQTCIIRVKILKTSREKIHKKLDALKTKNPVLYTFANTISLRKHRIT